VVVIAVCIDLLIVLIGVRQGLTYRYEPTGGEIVRSEVEQLVGEASLQLEYEYKVSGARHRGFALDRGVWLPRGKWAERFVEENPAGTEVTVYYDPKDPGESVLRRGVLPGQLFLVLMALPVHAYALWRRGRRWRGKGWYMGLMSVLGWASVGAVGSVLVLMLGRMTVASLSVALAVSGLTGVWGAIRWLRRRRDCAGANGS
jgi:hypothetical protein